MQVFQTKTGWVNLLISVLIVLMVAFMFVPNVTYYHKDEADTVSIYGYVFMPTEKPYKNVTKYLEDVAEEEGEEYNINDVYPEPMLLLVFGVVAILICFAGYKHWFSSVFPVVWGAIALKGCISNMVIELSSWLSVYYAIAVAVILLALVNFAFNTVLKKKEA